MINFIIAFVLGAYRYIGHKDPVFQAVSHLFVGGIFGAFFVTAFGALPTTKKRWDWLVIGSGLTLLELYVFLRDRGYF